MYIILIFDFFFFLIQFILLYLKIIILLIYNIEYNCYFINIIKFKLFLNKKYKEKYIMVKIIKK